VSGSDACHDAIPASGVPVINPEGFLSLEELTLLETAQFSADARSLTSENPGAHPQ